MGLKENIHSERLRNGLTLETVANRLGVSRQTVQKYESGVVANIPSDKIEKMAALFGTTPAALMDWEPAPGREPESEDLTYFEIIGSVAAGYGGTAVENHTGETVPIPTSFLKGYSKADFFVLRVSGNSMYPKILDGDLVLVQRCSSVDSGSIAVVLYNGDEATVKKVRYAAGEDWVELIPHNPEYQTKRLEGAQIADCRVLGRVIKLIRDI